MLRLRFLRLCVSEAEHSSTPPSSGVCAARSAAFRFGTSAIRQVSSRLRTPASTSAASASCGTAFGETNDVTSMLRNPLSIMSLMISILRCAGTT